MNRFLQAIVLSAASGSAIAQQPPGINTTTYWIYGLVGVTFLLGFIIAFVLSRRRDRQEGRRPPGTS